MSFVTSGATGHGRVPLVDRVSLLAIFSAIGAKGIKRNALSITLVVLGSVQLCFGTL